MNVGQWTLSELKQGYRYEEASHSYACNYCAARFAVGEVFSLGGRYYQAEVAAAKHVEMEHGGNLAQLLGSDCKYNTLTENQAELLRLFAAGVSDSEIAKTLGVSPSTVRRQKFAFREKAKQAKLFLAIYDQVFERPATAENGIVPVHDTATMVDDRYVTTEKEREKILHTYFSSLEPLRLKAFPPKQKKKLVILARIIEEFDAEKRYSEKEITGQLEEIYEDPVTLRRFLIEYGFIDRTRDGKEYWLR